AGLGTTGPVLLPALDSHVAPGVVLDGRVQVCGLAIGVEADDLVVPASDGVVRAPGVQRRQVQGLDPAFGLLEVTGSAALVVQPVAGDWTRAVALGHRALAAELVGNGRAMLE